VEKLFVDKDGEVEELFEGLEQHVRFPVHLAIRSQDGLPVDYSNFVLNLSQDSVFVETENPFSPGTKVTMHFYIPPEVKLLGEYEGVVVRPDANDPVRPKGMTLKFTGFFHRKALQRLEEFLEERRRLVDQLA